MSDRKAIVGCKLLVLFLHCQDRRVSVHRKDRVVVLHIVGGGGGVHICREGHPFCGDRVKCQANLLVFERDGHKLHFPFLHHQGRRVSVRRGGRNCRSGGHDDGGGGGGVHFGRTEYYSARCEAMKRSRGQFSDDVAMEIEFSKSHWSEVSRVEVAPQSAEEERLNRENREVLKQLVEQYPELFAETLGCDFVLGRMIAEGGQAKIYQVVDHPFHLMKVFERGTSLQDLQGSWPLPVLKESVFQCIIWAGLLEDGRFVFLMDRYWGDLRKLIDQAMLEKNVDGIQGPPFPYNRHEGAIGSYLDAFDFMLGIAQHMVDLHDQNVSHRDLKASNILLEGHLSIDNVGNVEGIVVADFECSIGVLGTKFWRAPEILANPRNANTFTNEQWKQADVYSYGMTCFEIVTGRIPFDGELESTRVDRQLVIDGKRPQLPSDMDDGVKDLITQCWESNPSLRPTFATIVNILKIITIEHCQFRLFNIGDELPPQYHLATMQEVNDYPRALRKAMPSWEIANLANGSVDGFYYGMKTRLERRAM